MHALFIIIEFKLMKLCCDNYIVSGGFHPFAKVRGRQLNEKASKPLNLHRTRFNYDS
jgi:hypothetical protein